MGVINLSVLVDKIKRKLLNSGFITSSDKAGKSKFGIVKIGDNLNVNSGVVSVPVADADTYGVVKTSELSGGMTMDPLVAAPITNIGTTQQEITLTADYTGYKFFCIVTVSSGDSHANITDTSIIYTDLGTWAMKRLSTQIKMFVSPVTDSATKIKLATGAGTISSAMIYGLK